MVISLSSPAFSLELEQCGVLLLLHLLIPSVRWAPGSFYLAIISFILPFLKGEPGHVLPGEDTGSPVSQALMKSLSF